MVITYFFRSFVSEFLTQIFYEVAKMKQNLTRAQKAILKWRQRDTVYKAILALQNSLKLETKWNDEWDEYKSEQNASFDNF